MRAHLVFYIYYSILVLGTPSLTFVGKSEDFNVGDRPELKCSLLDFDPDLGTLSYSWIRNNQPVGAAPNSETYLVPAVTKEDNGAKFQCKVTQSLSGLSTTSNEVKVDVHCKFII